MERITASNVRMTFKLRLDQSVRQYGAGCGEIEVLNGLDLTVRRGEFVAIVGPSGCGKSVFLDILSGLTTASGGSVRLDGRPVEGPDPRTGYVFQQYALFPWRNALSNIEYGLEVRGLPQERRTEIAKELLSLFGLCGFGDRYPYQLSGGMQQRVAIARALATDPEVLLMDEPFAALDAQTREILQNELLRIWEKIATTVVFVTHSIEEAVFLADRVVVMTARPGRVKEIFEIDLPRPRDEDVRSSAGFNAHRHRVWQALREEVNKAQKDWELASLYAGR